MVKGRDIVARVQPDYPHGSPWACTYSLHIAEVHVTLIFNTMCALDMLQVQKVHIAALLYKHLLLSGWVLSRAHPSGGVYPALA